MSNFKKIVFAFSASLLIGDTGYFHGILMDERNRPG